MMMADAEGFGKGACMQRGNSAPVLVTGMHVEFIILFLSMFIMSHPSH